MTKLRFGSFAAAAASLALPLSSVHAAALASDNAGNYTGNYAGANNGSGFGVYSVTGVTANSNTFIGTSTGNGFQGASGGIDTNGNSFGVYANSGNQLLVNRSFIADAAGQTFLGVGQTFSLSFDNGLVNTNSTVGFNLLAADNTDRFTFQFVGGQTDYVYNLGNGVNVDTGVGFTTNGLSVAFTQGTGNNFTLAITPTGGATTTLNGALLASAATGVSQFQVFDNNAGQGPNYDVFFNSPTVVPEPGTVSAVAMGTLGLWLVTRRRRRG